MATATENMSTRNPVTMDLAAGWSLVSTSTKVFPQGTMTVRLYTSAVPKRVIAGDLAVGQRGTSRYAGYLSTAATCLTTTTEDIETVVNELLQPQTEATEIAQAVRNSMAATTEAGV